VSPKVRGKEPFEVDNRFGNQLEREVDDVHGGLKDVLAAVRRTAAELLALAPQAPSTLSVRAGAVAVDMTWAAPASERQGDLATQPTTAPDDPTTFTVSATTVGVLYRCPSPGAAPFVQEGDQVSTGQQMAIVEAMKLMLPVETDRAGQVIEVLVEDGSYVEYGQPLFRLAVADGC
jgi:acetyl-CoA carboxylase biotin carboxyl carrier protein